MATRRTRTSTSKRSASRKSASRKSRSRPAASTATPAPTSPPPRICFDRVVPDEYNPGRAEAVRAIEDTHVRMPMGALGTIDITKASPVTRVRAALALVKQWQNGRVLRCRFLDGSPRQRRKVINNAEEWEDYASINFRFVTTGPAEIRVSFSADPGSWSALGTDALVERYFPRYQPTMNFGWLTDTLDDAETRRVVLHEFGHALGLIHEHQNPKARLRWNRAEVYRVFSGPPNYWSKADIDHNILQRYSPSGIKGSDYDDKSIMLYQFDGSLFLDGRGTPLNTQLSTKDRSFIRSMYPK